jgi:membrane-associated protease RseP (regulator of RpoE activity)
MSEPGVSIPASPLESDRPLPAPARPRYWLHGLLLLATCFTTLVVGAQLDFNFQNDVAQFPAGDGPLPFFPVRSALADPSRLSHGIPFSAALLIILLSHEMGHYLMCRYYGVRATLPFFIPAPTLIGTLGAVIRIKAPIRSRRALFHTQASELQLQLEYPPIFYFVQRVLRHVAPNRAVAVLPLGLVYLHPMAVAAWVGMYATALNLLPSGQLDGGHIVYALAPRAHRIISWMTVIAVVGLGVWAYQTDPDHSISGWWVWAGLITVMNVLTIRQKQAPDHPAIPGNRWGLALVAGAMLLLTITVSPFRMNR